MPRGWTGVLCIICAMDVFFCMAWSSDASVLSATIQTAKEHLQALCFSFIIALVVWTWAAHLAFGRRFCDFRTFWHSFAAFGGPSVGGNSNMEDAVLTPKVLTSEWVLATAIYLTYVGFIILMLFNVLQAILVRQLPQENILHNLPVDAPYAIIILDNQHFR